MSVPATAYGALLARAAIDPSEPLFTDLDLSAGTRVELSVATATNGAAKAAHLVAEVTAELGRPPVIGWRLPLHWQAVTLVLGCWGAGGRVLVGEGDDDPEQVDVLVLGPADLPESSARLPVRVWASQLHPFGLPFAQDPPFPLEDLTPLLRSQPDDPPPDHGAFDQVAVTAGGRDVTHADLLLQAAEFAETLNPHDRVLTCLPWSANDSWALAVALPLMDRHAGVLLRGLGDLGPADRTSALARVVAEELVHRVVGCDSGDAREP